MASRAVFRLAPIYCVSQSLFICWYMFGFKFQIKSWSLKMQTAYLYLFIHENSKWTKARCARTVEDVYVCTCMSVCIHTSQTIQPYLR